MSNLDASTPEEDIATMADVSLTIGVAGGTMTTLTTAVACRVRSRTVSAIEEVESALVAVATVVKSGKDKACLLIGRGQFSLKTGAV